MAYVLTNGKLFIKMSASGGVTKTDSVMEARKYMTTEKARERLEKAPAKTKGYYILDLDTCMKYQVKNGGKRIVYPKEIRQEIYDKAEGRCQLCGRKILYEEMTLDHITPLFFNGKDCVEIYNAHARFVIILRAISYRKNLLNVSQAFSFFQMKKRYGKSLKWKIVHRLLRGMLEVR